MPGYLDFQERILRLIASCLRKLIVLQAQSPPFTLGLVDEEINLVPPHLLVD